MLTGLGLFTRHLRGKGGLIAMLFLLSLASAATSLTSPLIGKTFIDSVVGEHNYALVPTLALALLGLALADLVLGACSRLVHTRLRPGSWWKFGNVCLLGVCMHPWPKSSGFARGTC